VFTILEQEYIRYQVANNINVYTHNMIKIRTITLYGMKKRRDY
jgi:hypothetical protein